MQQVVAIKSLALAVIVLAAMVAAVVGGLLSWSNGAKLGGAILVAGGTFGASMMIGLTAWTTVDSV